MDGIVYSDRKMKDFPMILIHLLDLIDILKKGWLNLKIHLVNE